MILPALFAATLLTSQIDDFFPLNPGTKWTYEDGSGLQMSEEVGEPIDIGKGVMAFPKYSSTTRNRTAAALYRTEENSAELVGFIDKSRKEPLSLFAPPQPILRVASGRADWQFSTEIPSSQGPVLQLVKGDSNKGSKRKVLDREVDTLVVHVFTQIGNDLNGVRIQQDAIYGKGIGLIEMTEATKAQGQTVKKVLKLVKFESAQG